MPVTFDTAAPAKKSGVVFDPTPVNPATSVAKASATAPPRKLEPLAAVDPNDALLNELGLGGLGSGAGVDPRAIGALVDIGAEGGGATAGQAIGAMTGPAAPVLIPVLGGVGGGFGNYAAQKRRIGTGEQDKFRYGELVSSILSSAIPGAPLAASGGKAVLREGGKQAAYGLIAKNIQTGIDEQRFATPTEGVLSTVIPAAGGALAQKVQAANPEIQAAVDAAAKAGKPLKQKTLEAMQELGGGVPASAVNTEGIGSWVNNRIESLAGPADVRRAFDIKNQKVANRVSPKEIGLPENTELTIDVLRDVRDKAAEPYREIAQISSKAKAEADAIRKAKFTASDPHELALQKNDPVTVNQLAPLDIQASADIEGLRKAREVMNNNRPPYPQADAARDKVYRDAKELVKKLEDDFEEAAKSAGRPELVSELKDSRTKIAKTHDIEKALNLGDADVSLPILGRMFDRGRGLTGDLKTLGAFAESFPRVVHEGAKTLPTGLSKTEALAGGFLSSKAVRGAAAGGAAYAGNLPLAAALYLAPPAISKTALALATSARYQRAMAHLPTPRIDATPDEIAAAIRLLSQSAGSNEEAAKYFSTPKDAMTPTR